ncbi:hypothetical protein Agub_g7488 [Astrephomene gubernaculifera]|uniref:Ion transport domain-containing protein n=1 Tax=Astrephomene gubernaculifera TaxID=47775 RepID=A0AAD3HMR3_9CHLO|nr:hypothetical protein Agub_g7488 [Astrephomene gubernaculifera]
MTTADCGLSPLDNSSSSSVMSSESNFSRVMPAEGCWGDMPYTSTYDALASQYPERSCFILRKRAHLRKFCVYLMHNKFFENFILFIILCNCVTLALGSNRQGFDSTPLGRALLAIDNVYVAIFTLEMLVKIIATGFVLEKGTYLRDGWNVLDFVVVGMAYVNLFTPNNLTGIRTIRALRPLRTVSHIRGMKVLVNTLLKSLPMLLDVFVLCAFTFFMFGIIAVQLFSGVLRYRCGEPDFTWAYNVTGADGQVMLRNVSYVVPDDQTEDACSGPLSSEAVWYLVDGTPTAQEGSGYGGRVCDDGMYCTLYGNPAGGLVSYDHILWAWLTIFQHITMSSWTDVMYTTMDAVSFWVWLFYVGLIIFGAFFMVNLALAVLTLNFSADNLAEEQEKQKAAEKEQQWGTGETNGGAGGGRSPAAPIKLHKPADLPTAEEEAAASGPPSHYNAVRRAAWHVAVSKQLEYTTAALIVANTAIMCINWHGMPTNIEQATNYTNYGFTIYFLLELIVKLTAFGFRKYFRDGMNIFDALVVLVSTVELIIDIIPSIAGVGPLSVLRAFRLLRVFRLARSWRDLNVIILGMFKSVQASIMLVLLMVLFLFIAALVGMQCFGYKFMFCDYVSGASPVCPLGMRVWGDCPNHFHCYLPCSADQYGSWVDAPGSFFNDLAYCQRFCATQQDADAAAATAAGNATAATAAGAAATAGDCEYLAMVGKSQVPRANFDGILWALYTVFQLLTGENWNDVMYDTMNTVSSWASLYFVAVIVIGNYLVFNLFIAILLDNLHMRIEEKSTEEPPRRVSEANGKRGSNKDSAVRGGADGSRSQRPGLPAGTAAPGRYCGDAMAWEPLSAEHDNKAGLKDEQQQGKGSCNGDIKPTLIGVAAAALKQHHQLQQQYHQQQPLLPETPSASTAGGSSQLSVPVANVSFPRPVAESLEPGLPAASVAAATASVAIGAAEAAGQEDSSRPSSACTPNLGKSNALPRLMVQFAGLPRIATPTKTTMANDAAAAAGPDSVANSSSFLPQMSQPDMSPQLSVGRIRRKESKSFLETMRSRLQTDPDWTTIEGRSLMLMTKHSGLRKRAARLVHNRHFDQAILVLIAASCVCLVLDAPDLDRHSRLARALHIMDYAFTGAFTLEAILKIITFGFAFTGKHAYIRSGWNVLDFLIVLLGYALIIVEVVGVTNTGNLKVLRVMRALRALRPLRAANRFDGLRVVVKTLFAVLPSMFNVALVCVLFYVIFAILSVNLFKGKLYSCVDADSGERLDPEYLLAPGQTLTRQWCEAGSVTITNSAHTAALNVTLPEYNISTAWINPTANFDNVGIAMLTLFQVATMSLWVDITFTAVDATEVDEQPIWNHNPAVITFFVFFIVVCTFFVLNLFIGVTLDKFAELQADQEQGGLLLSPAQQSWVDTQRVLMHTSVQYKPPRPQGRQRAALYDMVTQERFDWLIVAVIVVNVAFMAMVHFNMSGAWQNIMSYSNLAFTVVFAVEAGLKITAFGPLAYLRDKWNCFDFFVVLISAVSVALDFSNTKNLSFMPALRVLRVLRVLRLIRKAQGIQKLMRTLISSLPALANVGGVMLLFFFIYAVIGVNLFAGMKQGENLSRHANFNNMGSAMLLLFRMITGESWDGIMQDCMVTHGCVLLLSDTVSPSTGAPLAAGSYLDPGDPALAGLPEEAVDNQCAISPAAAVIYFPTFVILCGFVLLQLVIAVLIENLTQVNEAAEIPVPKNALDSFIEAWSEQDALGRGMLHASQLPLVLAMTEPPLGTHGADSTLATQRMLFGLDIPIYKGNKVSYIEVLHALAGSVCYAALPEPAVDKVHRELSKRLPPDDPHQRFSAAHYYAAVLVRAAIKGFLVRHAYRQQLLHVSQRHKCSGSGFIEIGTTGGGGMDEEACARYLRPQPKLRRSESSGSDRADGEPSQAHAGAMSNANTDSPDVRRCEPHAEEEVAASTPPDATPKAIAEAEVADPQAAAAAVGLVCRIDMGAKPVTHPAAATLQTLHADAASLPPFVPRTPTGSLRVPACPRASASMQRQPSVDFSQPSASQANLRVSSACSTATEQPACPGPATGPGVRLGVSGMPALPGCGSQNASASRGIGRPSEPALAPSRSVARSAADSGCSGPRAVPGQVSEPGGDMMRRRSRSDISHIRREKREAARSSGSESGTFYSAASSQKSMSCGTLKEGGESEDCGGAAPAAGGSGASAGRRGWFS